MQKATQGAGKPVLWSVLRRYFSQCDNLVLWALVLLAALLRLASLSQIEFKLDEVLHLERALRLSRGYELLLTGTQASVGITKPPLFIYLLALPTLLSTDPRFASGFIALLNVAAVAGFYLLVRRYYGWRAAAIAGALYAANPWAVLYARKIFTADLLAPFAVLMLWGLLRWLVDHRPGGLALAIGALGALLAITYSPWPLGLVLLILILTNLRRVRWPWLLAGLGAAFILFLPYVYYEISQHFSEYLALVQRLRSTQAAAVQASAGIPAWLLSLQYATWLHSGLNLAALAGPSYAAFQPGPGWIKALDYLAAALFGAGLVMAAWRALRGLLRRSHQDDVARYGVVALWLWLPLLTLWLQPAEVQVQYLVILYPLGFLAMGLALDRALAWLGTPAKCMKLVQRSLRFVLAGLLLAIVGYHSYSVFYLYRFVGEHETSYGVPFGVWQDIASQTRGLAERQSSDEVWVVAEGSDPQVDAEPAILNYLLGEQPKAVFLGQGGQEGLLLPVGRSGVYLLTRSSAVVERRLTQLGAQVGVTVTLPGGSQQARLFSAASRTLADVLLVAPGNRVDKTSDAGPELLGYDWPYPAQPGTTITLATYWTFGNIPSTERTAQHSAFNQLLYDDGRKAAQDDGFTLAERDWQTGRVLVQWFELALPGDLATGRYTLITGIYRLSDGVRSAWMDVQGQTVGDTLSLGPLQVGTRE